HTEPLFHFDGTGFRVVRPPDQLSLYGIGGVAGGDIWAFGLGGAYRWTAASGAWATDSALPYGVVMTALWGDAADDVWTVGRGGMVMRRGAGGGWPLAAGSITVGGSGYNVIAGTASDDVWATGNQRLGHFDGRAWTENAATLPAGAQPVAAPGLLL